MFIGVDIISHLLAQGAACKPNSPYLIGSFDPRRAGCQIVTGRWSVEALFSPTAPMLHLPNAPVHQEAKRKSRFVLRACVKSVDLMKWSTLFME